MGESLVPVSVYLFKRPFSQRHVFVSLENNCQSIDRIKMVRKTDSNGKGITTTSPWTMSNSMYQNTLHSRHSITEASLCTTIRGGLESFFYITGCARAGDFPFLPLSVPLSIYAVAPLSGIIIAYRPSYSVLTIIACRGPRTSTHTRNKGTAISQDLNGHRIDSSR